MHKLTVLSNILSEVNHVQFTFFFYNEDNILAAYFDFKNVDIIELV